MAQVATEATGQIRALAVTDPAAAADAAWAASGILHAAAALLDSPVLRQAADFYDRAARAPYGRIPVTTPAGNQLRYAARLLGALAWLTRDPVLTPIVLVTRLAALAEAVAHLRDAQQRAAQATAARASAEWLHAAARQFPAPATRQPPTPRPRAAAQLAGLSFPQPGPGHSPPTAGQPRPGLSAPRPVRRPSPPPRRPGPGP